MGTNGIVWFSDYTDEECLIIEDFTGWMPFRVLLTLLHEFRPRVRTDSNTFVRANWTHVIITSDRPPDQWYLAATDDELSQLTRRLHFVEKIEQRFHAPSLFDVPEGHFELEEAAPVAPLGSQDS